MGLFGKKKKEPVFVIKKNYIAIDRYNEQPLTECDTTEISQILQVQPKAQFIECSVAEITQYKEQGYLPGDFFERTRLEAKDFKA